MHNHVQNQSLKPWQYVRLGRTDEEREGMPKAEYFPGFRDPSEVTGKQEMYVSVKSSKGESLDKRELLP